MRDLRAWLLVVTAGAVTFLVVFSFLEFSPSAAEPVPSATEAPIATPTIVVPVATDSLAPRIDAGDLAVGVPITGSEALLRDVQPGDRLDVIASLPAPSTSQPLTAVLVRGATVLRPANGGDPLVIEVAAPDAIVLAHVVMDGTHLGYVLWPVSAAGGLATPPPLDDQTVRDALGLSAVATPTPAPPAPVATPVPAAVATLQASPGSGFLYQVQANDSWNSIATTFGIPVSDLRQWNEAVDATDPTPGSLVFIPRES